MQVWLLESFIWSCWSNKNGTLVQVPGNTMLLFLSSIIIQLSPLSPEHQSVSVGRYLLDLNNREFNQRTQQTLANHRLTPSTLRNL